jgi:hypothetical protein
MFYAILIVFNGLDKFYSLNYVIERIFISKKWRASSCLLRACKKKSWRGIEMIADC